MTLHSLTLFADYHQFVLQDEAAPGDESDTWQAASQRMMAVAEGVVRLSTLRNTHVPVTLELLDAAPPSELARFDHVVEGALSIRSGPLVVAGCTDYFPDAARFDLAPGVYRVRLGISGAESLTEDGLDGQDHYLVQVWPEPAIEPTVRKQGQF